MIGSASMSARMPTTRPLVSLRPLMRPTTPVRPIPSTTSSQPNSRSFVRDNRRGAMGVVQKFGMFVEITRHAAISSCISAIRFLTGMALLGLYVGSTRERLCAQNGNPSPLDPAVNRHASP